MRQVIVCSFEPALHLTDIIMNVFTFMAVMAPIILNYCMERILAMSHGTIGSFLVFLQVL